MKASLNKASAPGDIFNQAGIMLVTSRMRRLTERLMQDNVEMYRAYGLDFKPRWTPVFYVLADGEPHGVTDLARAVGQSHPSVCATVREMTAAGLVESRRGRGDARRSEVLLTEEGRRVRETIDEVWADATEAAQSVARESRHNLLAAICEWESLTARKSLFERLQEARASRLAAGIEIRPYVQERDREAFVRLTRGWMGRHFPIVSEVEEFLADPHAAYVATGGQILVAWDAANQRLAGACGLFRHEGVWEMAKLGVFPEYRRMGVAGRLVEAIAEEARARGTERLYLESASVFADALRLYRRHGFFDVPLLPGHYEGADVQMLRFLTPPGSGLRILPFDAGRHAEAFFELNRAWISEFWETEEEDLRLLRDPQASIVARGGQVLVVEREGTPVATCALCPVDDPAYDFELAKFTVSSLARGGGVGRLLLRATLDLARAFGARRLLLESNRLCKAAIHLYLEAGFKEVPISHPSLERVDIQMALELAR